MNPSFTPKTPPRLFVKVASRDGIYKDVVLYARVYLCLAGYLGSKEARKQIPSSLATPLSTRVSR